MDIDFRLVMLGLAIWFLGMRRAVAFFQGAKRRGGNPEVIEDLPYTTKW